jgi:hypothetical protein
MSLLASLVLLYTSQLFKKRSEGKQRKNDDIKWTIDEEITFFLTA